MGCSSAKPSEVTGTWVVTDKSRHRFLPAAQQKAAAKIVLDANGTFVSSEIPEDLLYGPPEAGTQLVTGSGDWKLVSREGKQQVQLTFETIAQGQRGAVPHGTQLNVSKGWSAVSLFYFQGGDADQGRKIEFEKK
jgi:hypothetical protein